MWHVSNIKSYNDADFKVVAIVSILIALLEVFLIAHYKRTYSAEAVEARRQKEAFYKRAKFEEESKVLGSKSRIQLLNADLCIKVKHMAGLPIAEGAEIFV